MHGSVLWVQPCVVRKLVWLCITSFASILQRSQIRLNENSPETLVAS